MASDVLDLDAVILPTKTIIIDGKEVTCHPVTVEQLVIMTKLQSDLMTVKHENEIMPLIEKALLPFIPTLKEDDLHFRMDQILSIIQFALKVSMPESANDAAEYTTEKKTVSSKESPISSDSTPPIK